MTDWYGPIHLAPFTFGENLMIAIMLLMFFAALFFLSLAIAWCIEKVMDRRRRRSRRYEIRRVL